MILIELSTQEFSRSLIMLLKQNVYNFPRVDPK